MSYSEVKFEEDAVFLVTGGAGFIGSNLVEALLKKGHKVRCLDNLSTGKQENVDLFINNPNYTFIKGDITDLDTWKQKFTNLYNRWVGKSATLKAGVGGQINDIDEL